MMSLNRHSHLAMKAARRIGSAKQKEKVGRTICHHLLMMIEQEEATGQPRIHSRSGDPTAFDQATAFAQQGASKRKQFSLGL